MELIIIIVIGLVAILAVISSFVRSAKKEKGCCSKYGPMCDDCATQFLEAEMKEIEKKQKKQNKTNN